jgi:hypothetical protein
MGESKQFAISTGDFLWGIITRFWTLIPGIALAGIDLYERKTGKGLEVSTPVFWAILATGIFLAALLTYHDLRKTASQSSPSPIPEVRTRARAGTTATTRMLPGGAVELEAALDTEEAHSEEASGKSPPAGSGKEEKAG